MTAKFDMYSREMSIDSDLIEKYIFINVREYSLLSSVPANSARCNLRYSFFFLFRVSSEKCHDRALFRRRKYRWCSAPPFQMTELFRGTENRKCIKLHEISGEKSHVHKRYFASEILTYEIFDA